MLCCKAKFTIVLRAVCVVFICGLLLSGASSYAVIDVSSDLALAPPLATKPPCEIVRNADGSFGVVTNTDVIELRGKETVRSVRQDETLGKSFRNRWAFVDVGYLIARILILTQEHKLRNPKDILIPLIKKHIRNRDGEAEILLEGFNIDGIEEVREGGEIIGFSLPVTRNGTPAHRLVYNLQSGETIIQMRDGKSVHVRVENSTYTQEVETTVQTSPHRLTIDECRQRLLENLRDLRSLFLSLQKELATGLKILKSENVDAFEKKAYPRIKEMADKIEVKVSAIKYLPAVLGFSEPEVRGKLDTFLRQIAEETKVDKVVIWFSEGCLTYTRGFSEQELMMFQHNRNEIFDVIIDTETLKAKDEKNLVEGRASLKRCGMVSGLGVMPDIKRCLHDENNDIVIIVGRSEECAKIYGELAEEDRTLLANRLNALIDARTAPWWEVRDWLKSNHYHDFDSFITILRHNGGPEMLDVRILPFIYSHLQNQIDRVKANDSESQKYFDNIVKNVEWMTQDSYMIECMDTFLQILENGTDFKPRNITQYVHDRVESFRQEATAKGLTFTTELSNEDLTVPNCDLNLMGIVIDNLIQNAIKYTKQGSIKVRLIRKMRKEKFGNEEERDSIVLEVEDTGIGIPKDERNKIFKRGYRASNVADIQGTGIGLDAVRVITSIMRGDVNIASEVGKGTTFTIRLPAAAKFSKGGINRVIPSEISTVFDNSVIMFPAASKAWVGMGRELYNNYEIARQLYDRAAMVLAYGDVSRLFLKSEDRNVTEYFAICTVLYEVAMYTTLCENAGHDIKPLATIGNSVGEIASAIISGAVSLEDGLRTVQFMSRIFDEVSEDADYAFFRISGIDATAIRHLLSRGEIEMVQDASPVFISIAVKRGIDFEKLCAEFTKAGSKHIQIFDPPLYKAPHLSIYERFREILINFIATIEVRDPKFPIISIVTGKPLTTAEEVRKELEEQFFRPVLWKDGIRKALQMGASSFVELGPGTTLTTLNKFLAPNVTSMAVNESYLSSVHHLQKVPSQRSTGQQREGLSNTFPSSERIHATNFQDILLYIQAQPQAQPLIVALGTSWIKGYEKGRYLQYDALNPLIGSLRVYCESKGIPFIVDDDDKLLVRINTERVKEGKTNAKVVVLAGENIVKSDEFAPLRNDEKNALVVGINNQELTTDSYIRLMEMLTLALRLSAGIEVSLDNAHITITKDNERHLYIFLPHAEPMDYEQLRQIYRVQEFA